MKWSKRDVIGVQESDNFFFFFFFYGGGFLPPTNTLDREAWHAEIYGVARSWTRLSD